MSSRSGQHRLNAGQFAEINQRGIQIAAISQARVFVGPALEHPFDVAMNRYESMGPEGDTTLIQTLQDLFLRRLEDAGASNHHLEFAIHAANTRDHAFAHFADEFDGHAPSLTFRGDAMFGETCRA